VIPLLCSLKKGAPIVIVVKFDSRTIYHFIARPSLFNVFEYRAVGWWTWKSGVLPARDVQTTSPVF